MAVFKRQVITNFGRVLSDAWKDVEAIDFKLQAVEHNPQFLQITAEWDVVVVVSLRFEFNEVTDSFNICIPFRT